MFMSCQDKWGKDKSLLWERMVNLSSWGNWGKFNVAEIQQNDMENGTKGSGLGLKLWKV